MQSFYTKSCPLHGENQHSDFIYINNSKDRLCIHDAYLKNVGPSIHPLPKTEACPV